MTILGPSTPDEYIFSFWIRECQKPSRLPFPPTEKERKEILIRKWKYKFPFNGQKEFKWQICRIETQEELEDLWIHQSDDFLAGHNLWLGSSTLGVTLLGEKLFRDNLGNFAKRAIETDFFRLGGYPETGQYKNYHRWKNQSLKGQLDGHEKPMLVQHEEYIDILDGFGRLLPYLALVLQGKEFFPFDAYFAT